MKVLTRQKAELLLALVIIARSSSYLVMKIGMQSLGPMTLIALRFFFACPVMALIFRWRLRHLDGRTLGYGALLGLALFAVMAAQMYGLKTTASSSVSFLVNTAVAFVPLLEALFLRRLPAPKVLLGAALALGGVALLTLKAGIGVSEGELLCLLSAVLYAGMILLTDRASHAVDPLAVGVLQIGFTGLLGLIFSLLLETPRLPQSGREWFVVLWLAVVCSAFGLVFQPEAQKYTTAERAGVFCALNPVASAVMGYLFLSERLGLRGVLGAALVVAGVLVSGIPDRRKLPAS